MEITGFRQQDAVWFLRTQADSRRLARVMPKIEDIRHSGQLVDAARRYYLEGKHTQAYEALQKLIEKEPYNPKAYYERARMLLWLGKKLNKPKTMETGFQDLLDALNLEPNNVEMLVFCAKTLVYDSDSYMKENDYLLHALAKDAGNIAANKMMGDIRAHEKDFGAAKEYYAAASGGFDLKAHEFAEILKEYAVKEHNFSDYEPEDVQLAFASPKLEAEYLAALGMRRTGFDTQPDADCLTISGVQHMRLGNYRQAEGELELAARMEEAKKQDNPAYKPDPKPFTYLGIVKLLRNDLVGAFPNFKQSVEYEEKWQDATKSFGLGLCGAMNARIENEFRISQDLIDNAIEIYPFEQAFIEASYGVQAKIRLYDTKIIRR